MLISITFLHGCIQKATDNKKEFDIEQSYQALKNPPFKKESFVQELQNVRTIEILESIDKYRRKRAQIYINYSGNLNTSTILSLIKKRSEDVFWIYVTPDNSLDNISHQILCQQMPSLPPTIAPSFKEAYTYEKQNILCFFDYKP